MRFMTFIGIYLLMPVWGFAAGISVRDWPDGAEGSVHSKSGSLSNADITVAGIQIGLATLKDIDAVFGKARGPYRYSRGEAVADEVCYVSQDGTRLIFHFGPMGGWKTLTAFDLISGEVPFKMDKECQKSSKVSKTLQTESGISLQQGLDEFKKRFGPPTDTHGDLFGFALAAKEKMTQEQIDSFMRVNNWDVKSNPFFDISSGILISTKNGKCTSLHVYKTESY